MSPRDKLEPTCSRDRLPFSVSTSSCEMDSRSSSDWPASSTTIAVISLVIDAMGSPASGFLLKSTCWVS